MNKKFIAFCALATTSTAALAAGEFQSINPACPPPCESAWIAPTCSPFNGLYVGVGVGGAFGDFNVKSNTAVFSPITVKPTRQLAYKDHDFDDNGLGTAFIGFGQAFKFLYLGAEVYGDLTRLRATSDATGTANLISNPAAQSVLATSTQAHLRNGEFGVDVRPGVFLTPTTLLYGRVGAAFNKITFNSSTTGITQGSGPTPVPPGPGPSPSPGPGPIPTPTPVPFPDFDYSKTKNVTGLRLGVGLEQMINCRLSLRADYIFTNYRDLDADAQTLVSGATLSNDATSKVRTNQFLVSASYYVLNDRTPFCLNRDCFVDGFYVGAGLGAIKADFDSNSSTSVHDTDEGLAGTLQQNYRGQRGEVLGNAFVGFGKAICNGYLGVEAYGNIAQLRSHAKVFASEINSASIQPVTVSLANATQLKLNDAEGGVDLRPGWFLSPSTLVYGRVGAAFNQITLKSSTVATAGPETNPFSYSKKKTATGLRLGVGLEQMVNCNFSIRGDYIYTNYGSIHAKRSLDTDTDESGSSPSPNFIVNDTHSKVRSNAFLISMVYHLNNWI